MPEDYINYLDHAEFYEKIWNLYVKVKGHVIITEDLQENPTEVFKETFKLFGQDFKESFLKFEPYTESRLPDYLIILKTGVIGMKTVLIQLNLGLERVILKVWTLRKNGRMKK